MAHHARLDLDTLTMLLGRPQLAVLSLAHAAVHVTLTAAHASATSKGKGRARPSRGEASGLTMMRPDDTYRQPAVVFERALKAAMNS